MIRLTSLIPKLAARAFPLVRKSKLLAVYQEWKISEEYYSGKIQEWKAMVESVQKQVFSVEESNRKLRETVLGAENVGKFRGDFEPGHSPTSSTARFGRADGPPVDNGSVASITAVALRKFNEVILLQADFEAVAMDATHLEFTLGGEKWNVAFVLANLEN